MTLTSQNGWPVYDHDTSHFTQFESGGRKWQAANDDVAVCAKRFIDRFNAEVEPIISKTGETLDDWSYNPDLRPIRGQDTGYSNHDSATAWDLNALKHPRGVHHTFTEKQADAFRKIRNEITDDAGRPVFRLGMDYSSKSTVDDMHVEVDTDHKGMKQAADKIRGEDDGMANITPAEYAKLISETQVKLTKAAAAAMSSSGQPRKEGDEISVSYLLQWGGAGAYREWADVKALKAEVSELVSAVKLLTTEVAALKSSAK